MHIPTLVVTVAGALTFAVLWTWVRKNSDPKKTLMDILEKNGLMAPLLTSVSEVDWRIGCGEATRNGQRVRFNTAPTDDGMVIITTSPFGHQEVLVVAV